MKALVHLTVTKVLLWMCFIWIDTIEACIGYPKLQGILAVIGPRDQFGRYPRWGVKAVFHACSVCVFVCWWFFLVIFCFCFWLLFLFFYLLSQLGYLRRLHSTRRNGVAPITSCACWVCVSWNLRGFSPRRPGFLKSVLWSLMQANTDW